MRFTESVLAPLLGVALFTLVGQVERRLECPSIRLDDGRIVYLSRLPSDFAPGERVVVTGSGRAGDARCQQEVVIVESVRPAGPQE